MTKAYEQRKRDRKLIPEKPWPTKPQDEKILLTKNYSAGYRVETVLIDCLGHMGRPRKRYVQMAGRFLVMRCAVTESGHYIGEPGFAWRLHNKNKWGLSQIQPSEDGTTCCIGFNETEQKWYGWSHRAMCGFGRGDKLFEENWKHATDDTPFRKHGGRTIKTMPQAKKAALAFAESVS